MTRKMTALVAIRAKCMDCTGWQMGEVRECPARQCPLWGYRFGKSPKGMDVPMIDTTAWNVVYTPHSWGTYRNCGEEVDYENHKSNHIGRPVARVSRVC